MKVLVATGLYPPEIGGPATYSKTLEEELPKRGIEVLVVPFSRARRYWKIVRHIIYFFLILRAGRDADMIYAQDPVSVGFPAALAALALRKKFVLKVVGDYGWEQATQRSGFTGTLEDFQSAELTLLPEVLRSIERWVAKRATRIVVPSKYLAGIVKMWGVEKGNITVIYNGIEQLGDTGNKPVLRGLLQFHGKLVITIGRLVPWKGFDALISLMPTLRKEFPDLKLMIVGSGPDAARLEAKAESLGLADDIIFTGALPRDVLIRYLRASDVFVLNTSYEGFSHQLLEVMAVGVPVVTTKVGGNPEIVEHEKNGYLVQAGDRSRIAAFAGMLLRDAALRAKLVAAGKRTAAQFSVPRMADETAKLLKRI